MFVVTLVGTPTLSEADARRASEFCGADGPTWITAGRAADIFVKSAPDLAALESEFPDLDIVLQEAAHRQPKLFVADMDSTMIQVECIDELADYAGLKAEIAAVTEAAMRGELDFEAALRRRVALLEGLDASAIDRCREERVRFTPGAETLIATLADRGVWTVLVSGGFTAFAEPVGDALGFHRVVANVLDIKGGKLTGGLDGPIVDAQVKADVLTEEQERLGISRETVFAIGDGANDLRMVDAAGLGIAYHAKPALADAANARIRNGDLTTLLFALGIPEAEWKRP